MLAPHMEPQAAYPAGTDLAQLDTVESFIVVVVRLWAAERIEPDLGHADWRDGFAAAGIDEAGSACFASFLNIIEVTARRRIEIGCPDSTLLMHDEGQLLCAMAMIQQERIAEAALLLADWLPPTAVCIAVDRAAEFIIALIEADLALPWRCFETRSSRRAIACLPDGHAPPTQTIH